MKTTFANTAAWPETPVEVPVAERNTPSGAKRFTLDGNAGLEKQLETICAWVRDELRQRLPAAKLEAIVLGGGYGRGEGGVLRSDSGDQPYNDMEFYVYLRGNRLLNELRHRADLVKIEHELTSLARIEVEFKLQSLTQTRKSRISMFSYDLAMGHRVVLGREALFEHCGHHRNALQIPLSELTRLLMNRCTGLLFAKQRLEAREFSRDDADFVARNLAKVRLAMGDVVLGRFGDYHWSCRERARRLEIIPPGADTPWLGAVQQEYQKGTGFKLHPSRTMASHRQLYADFQSISDLSGKVWLWLESLRLKRNFTSFADYALAQDNKCPQSKGWKNFLINLRQFGSAGIYSRSRFRYPRERMLRTLPLLLWEKSHAPDAPCQKVLAEQLSLGKGKSSAFIDAYAHIWERFR